MKKIIFTSIYVVLSQISIAQVWEDKVKIQNKDATYFEMVESFNQYKENIPYTKGNGYKPYARSLNFLESRMPKNGIFPSNSLCNEWILLKNSETPSNTSNWGPLGPFDVPIIQSNGKKRGNGRVNCITFHPTNPDVFWAGSPGGGLWKTIDDGNSWSTNTDNLPVLSTPYLSVFVSCPLKSTKA